MTKAADSGTMPFEMLRRSMTEAEARYHDAVADDCRRILGQGVELLDLAVEESSTSTRFTITYLLDGWEGQTEAAGDTVIEAHAALREALVLDRVKLGFRAMTDPRILDRSG